MKRTVNDPVPSPHRALERLTGALETNLSPPSAVHTLLIGEPAVTTEGEGSRSWWQGESQGRNGLGLRAHERGPVRAHGAGSGPRSRW